jgi:mannose-6-phosphate isomerase
LQRIAPLRNTIQEYAWGSRSALAELLGEPSPSPGPQAELWMGAHPGAPSRIVAGNTELSLPEVIARDPAALLGAEVAGRFDGELPFLLKLLAAAEPLSLQAHPNADQARVGFDRDNARGLAPDARDRSYRDARHKPELICALTRFEALVGFRRIAESLKRLEALRIAALTDAVARLAADPTRRGLASFFIGLLGAPRPDAERIAAQAAEGAAERASDDPAFAWVVRLHEYYPGDVGVLAPVLLNHVALEPGQALFLAAGELHSYLGGLGVEVMANSDNVLRGGLTAKHIDPAELGRVLTFRPGDPELLAPEPVSESEAAYLTPAAEFRLSVIRLDPGRVHIATDRRCVEILLCTEGGCEIVEDAGRTPLSHGESVLAPAASGRYRITGGDRGAVVYKVSVPHA